MPPPALTAVPTALYAAIAPHAVRDAEADYALATWCQGIGQMFDEIEDLVRDTPEGIGWSKVVDINRTPDKWVDWMTQFVGQLLFPNDDTETRKDRIVSRDTFNRGSVPAFRAALRRTLTGNRQVIFNERQNGSAWRLGVITFVSETPDEEASRAEMLTQKPGGIVLNYTVADEYNYKMLRESYDDYGEVIDLRQTYMALRDNPPETEET